jgi:hypothetical protein
VDSQLFLFPPLDIKLGVMKDFVKALNINSDGRNCSKQMFLKLSGEKLKKMSLLVRDIEKCS